MSRNMKEANKHIFSVLTKFVEKSDTSVELPEGTRFIKTDEDEKEWLKKSLIDEKYSVLPALKVSSLKFGGKKYFIVIGWESPGDSTEILTHIPLNAGLVTALIYKLNIPVRRGIDPLSIVNEVLFEYKEGTEDYSGHGFDLIINFFEPFHVYEIKEDSPIEKSDMLRIAGHFICENKDRLFLPFSSETICKFEKLFMEGIPGIPYENLLLSLTSIHWKFSFLDIYRCIERLFPVVSLNALHQSIECPVSLFHFSEEVEEKIRWRPKESEAINILLKEIPDEVRELLQEVKTSLDGTPKGEIGSSFSEQINKINKMLLKELPDEIRRFLEEMKTSLDGTPKGEIGSFFYKIRNSIVHYRASTPIYAPGNEADWDKLIKAGLAVIDYWYNHKKYGETENV